MIVDEDAQLLIVRVILIFLKFAAAFCFVIALFVLTAVLVEYSPTFRNWALKVEIWIRQRLANRQG